jgi:hypothetical protein
MSDADGSGSVDGAEFPSLCFKVCSHLIQQDTSTFHSTNANYARSYQNCSGNSVGSLDWRALGVRLRPREMAAMLEVFEMHLD